MIGLKLNLTFYHERPEQLTEEEQKIIAEKIGRSESDEELIAQDPELEVVLALSQIRKNLLSWYPFPSTGTILEIEPNLGELTGLLCEKAQKVVSIEHSLAKAQAIKKREKNRENLEIIVGEIAEISLTEKFDVIVMVGILEKLSTFYQGTVEEFLNHITSFLKPEGKILLAMDNRLGIKYFSQTDKTGIEITNPVDTEFFTEKEILEYTQKSGFAYTKTYYPMPDYKMPNVIFTEEKKMTINELERNIVYYGPDAIKFYPQNKAYQQIMQYDPSLFKVFANSYLFEISKKPLETSEIQFISYANMRKPEYRIKTIMEKQFVYKYPANEKSVKHIEHIKQNIHLLKQQGIKTVDSFDETRIISQYTEAPTLDKIIVSLIEQNQKEEAIALIEQFKQELQEKLQVVTDHQNNVLDQYQISYQPEEIQSLTFLNYGLWDAIFQNCFYQDHGFYFYDQEWREEKVPLEFILYRGILYLGQPESLITKEELYEAFGIHNNEIHLFEQLDNQLQEKIRNPVMWKLHTQGTDVLQIKRNELTANHHINLLTQENKQKEEQINEQNQELDKLRNSLKTMTQSYSWQITRPLRKLKQLGRKK